MTLAAFIAAVAMAAPHPMPQIIHAPCPWQAETTFGCFYAHGTDGQSGPVVYLNDPGYTFGRWHELGHAADTENLTDGERRAIMAAMRWRSWRVEQFADFYAGCRLRLDPHRGDFRLQRIFGVWRGRAIVARRCGLIARAVEG